MRHVLVTGGSGFLAGHCILQLLVAGHQVRTTLRAPGREAQVRAMLKMGGVEPADALSFCVADLHRDEGWAKAVAGCDYVLHIASPFPARQPKNADDLIIPAREGALRVLRAARDADVKRVVLTSSFAAIGYGSAEKQTYTEEDWTNSAASNAPYIRSKAIAERAAWDFMTREGGSLELSVVNPTGIFGPVFGPDFSASIGIVKGMLDGSIPGLPDIWFGVVDVRDVADLHLRAMSHCKAAGERFIAVSGPSISMLGVADILRARLGDAASRVPTKSLANWKVRLAALFSANARQTVPNLGKRRNASGAKALNVLDWQPRSAEHAIVATGESLIRLGIAARPR